MWLLTMGEGNSVTQVPTVDNLPTVGMGGAGRSTAQVASQATNQVPSNNVQSGVNQSNTGQNVDAGSGQPSQAVPYERFQEVNHSLRETRSQLEDLKQYVESMKTQQQPVNQAYGAGQPAGVDPELAQALSTLRGAGVPLRDDVASIVDQRLEQKFAAQKAQDTFISQITDLEKQYDGSNGFPKFDSQEVVKFMDREGIVNPETAYRTLHFDAIVDARVKGARSTPYSEKPGQPMQTAGSDDSAKFQEAVRTGDFRDILMQRIGLNK